MQNPKCKKKLITIIIKINKIETRLKDSNVNRNSYKINVINIIDLSYKKRSIGEKTQIP